jgi:glycosyltransferase involved in cell wall biosynthesis
MVATQPLEASRESGHPPPDAVAKRLVYVCLQQTREGQASYAHVHEIIAGLRRRGWTVDLREIQADRSRSHSRWYFLWHYLKPQLKLWFGAAPPAEAMYIRADALALPAFLWARLRRIPVVLEVNGPHSDRVVAKPWLRPLAPLLARLQRFQFRRSAALIAVTPRLAEWVGEEAPGRHVEIIPNGANTDLFHPQARPTRQTAARYVILVGLLAKWQGISLLLAAVKDPAWPSDVSLVVAGDGTERDHVIDAARNNPRVRYLGTVPYRDVPGLVAASLAGLSLKTTVAGRTETGMSPLKLYETLACGVPAIVTEYHGQADVVREHQCGIIVSQDDPSALARAVARIATDDNQRQVWGANGRRAVEQQHSWDERAGRTDRLLRSLL